MARRGSYRGTEEKRARIVAAAFAEFSSGGYESASLRSIAAAAEMSHPGLLHHFPTKNDLVVAVATRCHERILQTFADAAAGAEEQGCTVLEAMGAAYVELLADRRLLVLQLQLHAAATSMPEVRDCTRVGFRHMVELVQRESGVSDEEVRAFFAQGMLINVLGAMDAPAVDEPWARLLMGDHK